MRDGDRDWAGYIRSLSRNGSCPFCAPQELQRSGGSDSEVGWETEQGYGPSSVFEEHIILLGRELRGESDTPKAWSSEDEDAFQEEINRLWDDYENDQKEIQDNEEDTEEP